MAGGISIRVDTSGLRDLAGRFQRNTPENTGRFRDTLRSILRDAAAAAKAAAPVRTGKLRRSINYRTDVNAGAHFRGTLYASAPHAGFVHDGTRAHPIVARGRVLRFLGRDGRVVYTRRVQHPGTKPNPFLKQGWEQAGVERRLKGLAAHVATDTVRR